MDNLERRLLIEQTRKEVLDEIKKYEVGFAAGGNIMVRDYEDGYVFILPIEKCLELFRRAK